MTDLKEAIELLEKAKDHYWDTLEPHKELIIKHLEAIAKLRKVPEQPLAGEFTKKLRNFVKLQEAINADLLAACEAQEKVAAIAKAEQS